MAITDVTLLWQETSRDDMMIAGLAIDNVSTDGYRVNLGRQYYRAHGRPIVPRVARLTISGAYNYVTVDLDGVSRTFRHQGAYTLRLAGQQFLTVTARTRGAAPARMTILFYSDDRFFPPTSSDVFYRDGSSGEPLAITYNVITRVVGAGWNYTNASTPPFAAGLSVQNALELRPQNSARFDFLDNVALNGRLFGNVRGYFDGAANNIRNFVPCFAFDETDRDRMFSQNVDGIITAYGPPSPYFWKASNTRIYSDNALKNLRLMSSIGGRGALYVAMRPPRNNVTNAYRAPGTNTAAVAGTLTIEMF